MQQATPGDFGFSSLKHPERFDLGPPTVSPLPDAVWINPSKPAPGAVEGKGSLIAVDLSEVKAIKEPATAGGVLAIKDTDANT